MDLTNRINVAFLVSVANACQGCVGVKRKMDKEMLSRVKEETMEMIKRALDEIRQARDARECSSNFCDYVSELLNLFSMECLKCKRKSPLVSDHLYFHFLDPYDEWIKNERVREIKEAEKYTFIDEARRRGSLIKPDPRFWSGGKKQQK